MSITALIHSSQNGKQNNRRDYLYATEIDECPRKIYFNIKGYPSSPPFPRLKEILENGKMVHMRLISRLISLGVVVAAEVDIPGNELIHGRADAIVNINKETYVLEIKSSNRDSFERMRFPNPSHLKQIYIYMHFLKIPRGILLYENKDNQELKEFSITYDQAFAERLLESLELKHGKIFSDTIPPVPEDIIRNSWKCRDCPYRVECKNEKGRNCEELQAA